MHRPLPQATSLASIAAAAEVVAAVHCIYKWLNVCARSVPPRRMPMSRRSIVIAAVLVMLGTWGFRHTLKSTPVVAAGTHLPSTAFCPRFGLNPPQRLPVVHDAVSISFDGSRLVAVDRQGQVW